MPKAQSLQANPLGTESVGKLLFKFAVPSIVSGLVGAFYNIVDQFFIGQGVGMLGNAATNVAFPLNTICIAAALLLGIGSASGFSLALGAGKKEEASRIVSGGATLMILLGCLLAALVLLFLEPMLLLFGASSGVLPYAVTYTGITAFGMPFLIFSTGFSSLIRSDGSPTYSMVCVIVGAVLNTILDPLFIFTLDMGMAGAAWATVIGQGVSAVLCFIYLFRFRSVRLVRRDFLPKPATVKHICALGAAACFNQLAMTVVQIVMNNALTFYGATSRYGPDIPLAVVGIITKVYFIFLSVIIGISQGNQPIVGFNYGAKQYERVKKTYRNAVIAASVVAVAGFLCFQLFPREIISLFGGGSEDYYHFAERYFRIFMMMFFLIGIQPVTANFFTSLGHAKLGIFLSLTRQILFLLPLILLFPRLFGIDGIMYAGPIADLAAAILALVLVRREMIRMDAKAKEEG
ncbi:MATE family efflux transporter [Ruminococcaceae bacterium OttesenSCG-928-I18]|nr:MATE family efflux transporter [Ruminococcaceae bacterium OttesenSCG-928-I18]